MKFFTFCFALVSLATVSVSVCAKQDTAISADDKALNQTYTEFMTAFNTLDYHVIENLYAADASYIPEGQEKQIINGGENIAALYQSFFSKIQRKKAFIDVDFRVIKRKIDGKNATDIGYYLVRFQPPKETEEPVSEFAGKFVIVYHKTKNGQWQLAIDSNNRAEPRFYFEAKPTPNLYYGRQFPVLAPVIKANEHK